MKKLVLGSVVAAALVFTGCGSDDDTPAAGADKVKPAVSSTASGAGAAKLTLATDNKGVTKVTITGADAAKFTVNADKTVTIPATPATYNITVTAEDAAGNKTTQDVVVTVTGGNGGGNATRTAANPYIDSDIVTIGTNKWLKIKGSSGGTDDLLNDDNTTAYSYRRTWSDANTTCNTLTLDGGSWHLPSRDEAQALFTGFALGNTDANGVTTFTGTLMTDIVGENGDAGNAVIWTNEATNEGIFIGGHTYNYTNGDNSPFSFSCVK